MNAGVKEVVIANAILKQLIAEAAEAVRSAHADYRSSLIYWRAHRMDMASKAIDDAIAALEAAPPFPDVKTLLTDFRHLAGRE